MLKHSLCKLTVIFRDKKLRFDDNTLASPRPRGLAGVWLWGSLAVVVHQFHFLAIKILLPFIGALGLVVAVFLEALLVIGPLRISDPVGVVLGRDPLTSGQKGQDHEAHQEARSH